MKMINKRITLSLCCIVYTALTHARIFFLDGTSSVGKSSIVNILRDREQWGAVASLYWDWSPNKLAELFPDDMATINDAIAPENVIHALRRGITIFKQDITQQQKDEAIASIACIRAAFSDEQDSSLYDAYMHEFKEYSIAKLQESADAQDNVLIDGSWYLDQESILPGRMKYAVLVYCPFDTMINRIIDRSQQAFEKANVINHRFFSEGMRAFLRIYALSPEPEGAVDIIDKATVQKALELVELVLKPSIHSCKKRYIVQEFSREQFEEYKNDLLAKFKNSEALYVVPKKHYDLVIKTDSMDSAACAQQIINFNLNKNSI